MNLIESPWLPVRYASGARRWIAPHEIADDSAADAVIALDFPRPDWNAAVTEFLIGLTALAFQPNSDDDWRVIWREPPTPNVFREKLSPFTSAFELLGDGPRAFQDLDALGDAEEKDIAQLLIEAPGGSALTKNTDLFQKRGVVDALAAPYAAAALITLQTFAPSGGVGHRTSLRGGGPLTTLVRPSATATLWQIIWANIPFVRDVPEDGLEDSEWAKVLPWLSPARTSDSGKSAVGEVPEDAHSLQAFFGTPRRIRLGAFESEVACALGGPTHWPCIKFYKAKNYGVNYMGWRHPLSPYRLDEKQSLMFPLHPRADRPTYRDWLGYWAAADPNTRFPAACVLSWRDQRARLAQGEKHWLDAWGFAMDNAKPLAWIETRIPAFAFDDKDAGALFYSSIATLIDAADKAARGLQFAVKVALFGAWSAKNNSFQLPDGVKSEAADDVGEAFWRNTQHDFEVLLEQIAAAPKSFDEAMKRSWLRAIRAAAIDLFEGRLGGDEAYWEDPKRIVFAKGGLSRELSEYSKAAKALGIVPAEKKQEGSAA